MALRLSFWAEVTRLLCGVHSSSVNATPSMISNGARPDFLPVACISWRTALWTLGSLSNASPDLPSTPTSFAFWISAFSMTLTIAIGLFLSWAAYTQMFCTMGFVR